MTDKIKTGYTTTEFWMALATSIFGVAMALGFMTAEDVDSWTQIVKEFSGAIITVVSVGSYAVSRGIAKKPAAEISTVES